MPYAAALALTLAVEVPLYAVALVVGAGWRARTAVAAAAGINLLTHPLAWLLLLQPGTAYPGRFWIVECGIWLVESALLYAIARRDPALLALIALVANAASALAGVGAWLLGW